MAATYGVKVKWGANSYDVQLSTDEPVPVFKAQLFALTGVPPEKQKIAGFAGGPLKDDASWATLGVKEGKQLLLIGTAEELAPPAAAVVFVEDLSASEAARLAVTLPCGLTNLGNTCYLAAAVQVLRLPELQTLLARVPRAADNGSGESALAAEMGVLLSNMSSSVEPFVPLSLILRLRQLHPQFAERGEGGGFKQQDAEEAWTIITSALASGLPAESAAAFRALFTGVNSISIACADADEPTTRSHEPFVKLTCSIGDDTNYLLDGLKAGMREVIEKNSPSLGRSAHYVKTTTLAALPAYLSVSLGRFFWKAREQIKAKILRNVRFPAELDVFDLCSPELQAELAPARKVLADARDALATAELASKRAKSGKGPAAAAAASGTDGGVVPMETSGARSASGPVCYTPLDVTALPSTINKTGIYELCGVLTHQGRTADSGHYVGWSKSPDGQWLCFDDERVREVTEDEVLKLSGGGDWHIAYILVYRTKRFRELDA